MDLELFKYLVLRFIQQKLGRHDLSSHVQGGRLDDPYGDDPPASGSPAVVVQLPEHLGPAARVSRASTLPDSSPPSHLLLALSPPSPCQEKHLCPPPNLLPNPLLRTEPRQKGATDSENPLTSRPRDRQQACLPPTHPEL